ncbi:FHA domain-containing protein [Nocardioides sp. AE5]|uniref:FHA domain-containing protein n=1 Tax=Nocardioides sp. AE5 TaxID=2962573 RepID=UPI002880E2A1|nr:FHA domain-containing protein [Nocardioides sp. AE5]MDT0200346.1 FHA domain-containing protein [Nocardioides sp. AE5]
MTDVDVQIEMRWATGRHHGLAWSSGVALLDAGVDLAVVNKLWERLDEPGRATLEVGDFLNVLAECVGAGLLGLPPFAVIVMGAQGAHCAVRGDGTITVEADPGSVTVSGVGVTTWSERQVPGARRAVLATPEADPGAVATTGRLLRSGVVPASGMSLAMRAGTPAPTPAADVPAPARGRLSPDFITSVPRGSSAAPVRPVRPAPPRKGDHDGETIAQVPPAASTPRPPTPPASTPPAPTAAGDVLAVVCASGHANPPQRVACRVCGADLDQAPRRVPQPSLGRVVSSTGESLELTGPVIVGRAPRAARFTGAQAPRLLTLPHAHVSASHLALRVEGWSVLVRDLGSTNGTFLRRHEQPPFRLSDQPQLLVPGDVVDLGHGAQLFFEELP